MSDESYSRFGEEVDVEVRAYLNWIMSRATNSLHLPTDDRGIAKAVIDVLEEEEIIGRKRKIHAAMVLYGLASGLREKLVAQISEQENQRWLRQFREIPQTKELSDATIQYFILIGLAVERVIKRDFPHLYLIRDTGNIVEFPKPGK